MEIHINDNEKLIGMLRSNGLESRPVIIGIDGAAGVGKSRLAYCIGCRVGVPVINIDHYANDISGLYADAVDKNALGRLTARYIKSQRSYVIEGVCLLEVLEVLNVVPGILVYYKKYNNRKEWEDEDLCNCNLSQQALSLLPPLSGAIAKYHNKYKPIYKANMIVFRNNAG